MAKPAADQGRGTACRLAGGGILFSTQPEWLKYSRGQLKVNTRSYIQGFSCLKRIGLLLFALTTLCARTEAQTSFGASVSTASTFTNGLITYTLGVTNLSAGPFQTQNVFVTNIISSGVQVVGVFTNYPSTTFTSVSNRLVFNIPDVTLGSPAIVQIQVFSTNAVSLTNFVSFFVVSPSNSFTTSLVTLVTNISASRTDLAVSIQIPPTPVLVNDYVTYGVILTNLGPSTATNVFLTNSIGGAIFPGTNQSLVNLGNISSGASKRFNVQFQPTSSGTLTLSAALAGGTFNDTNSVNDSAITNITVEAALTNILVATNLRPAMVFNPQNSVMEQTIRLVNVSQTNEVASARVIVTGLASSNRLYNAVGTNNGNPYVVYAASLAPGESVDLLMQYIVSNRLSVAIDNTNYLALPTSAFSVVAATNYTLQITNYVVLPSQAFLIEFPAIKGRTYTILYSSDLLTNTLLAAQPPIVAQADKVQWIDDGPPKTISHPMNAPSRLYRVLLNP
jgi:hypothetical protein